MNWPSVFKSAPIVTAKEDPKPRSTSLDIFVHPFHKDNLSWVEIKIEKATYGPNKGGINFTAQAWFNGNGDTGIKKLTGDSLQDLVNKVNAFLETI